MITKYLRRDVGFSLIELLVVVIIIGILGAIAIPVYLGVQSGARDSSLKADLDQARQIMIQSQSKTNAFPANVSALLTAGFNPGTQSTSDYTVTWSVTNITTTSFCVRAAVTGTVAKDLWASARGSIIGPIATTDTASRPVGC